jgi:hypothetical protein
MDDQFNKAYKQINEINLGRCYVKLPQSEWIKPQHGNRANVQNNKWELFHTKFVN